MGTASTAVGRAQSVRRGAAVSAMLAQELVQDVAERLGACGIDVMPVKGALLHKLIYDDPADRPVTDVDILIRPADRRRAAAVLTKAGYCQVSGGLGQIASEFTTPFEVSLDLHGSLFDEARYCFVPADLFARGKRDVTLFQAHVVIPAPMDVYAHLVGKFASDHLDRYSSWRLRELGLVSSRLSLDPYETASHLLACGMRRAARYVLGLSRDHRSDEFAAQVLSVLAPDPVGDLLARVGREVLEERSPYSRTAAVVAHLLNDSVPRGLWSGVRAAVKNTQR